MRSVQYGLTGMRQSKWLRGRRFAQVLQDLLRALSRNDAAQFFQSRPLNIGHASKFPKQLLRRLRANAGDFTESGVRLAFPPPLPVKRHGKTVSLVADLLDEVEDWRMPLQNDRFVLLA